MLLFELDKKDKVQSEAEDNSVAFKTDTRKTRLTLEQLSKLRKLSDIKSVEYQTSVQEIRRQFAPAASE